MRIYFHLPYRQTEGIIKATGKNFPNHPSYSQICRRVNQLDISSNRLDDDDDNDGIIIAIDSTGIKVTNRGQWMQDKWNIKKKKKKKGYLKIHIAVDVKTKEILDLEVTDDDEKVYDGKIMPKLIEHILKNDNNIKIMSVIGDRSYDSNGNFKYLQNKRILPAIKVRKNSRIVKNNSLRNREVYSQLKDLLKWNKRRGWIEAGGWIAETIFFIIKRVYVWRIYIHKQ
jgi:hypothetical protein